MHNFYLRKPAPLGNWVTQVTVTISMPPWSPLQLSCLMPGEWGSLLHTGGAPVRLHLLGEVVPGPWTSLKGDTATRLPLLLSLVAHLFYSKTSKLRFLMAKCCKQGREKIMSWYMIHT